MNYDAWFDLLRLLESDGDLDQIRDTYERAIANIPPSMVSIGQSIQGLQLKSVLFKFQKKVNVRFLLEWGQRIVLSLP